MELQKDIKKSLKTKVFESLGEASMCWSETPNAIFDSSKATEIGNELLETINNEIEVYRKIAYEVAKSQIGKFFVIDTNLLSDPKEMDMKEFFKITNGFGIQVLKNSEPTLEEAIKVLQKHLRKDKSESDGLKPQILNSKKLEILKSIANSGGIDWDEVIENERIVSLQLKTF